MILVPFTALLKEEKIFSTVEEDILSVSKKGKGKQSNKLKFLSQTSAS